MRIEDKVIEIQEDVRIRQDGHDLILEKGDKIGILENYIPKIVKSSNLYRIPRFFDYTESVKYLMDDLNIPNLARDIAQNFKYIKKEDFMIIEIYATKPSSSFTKFTYKEAIDSKIEYSFNVSGYNLNTDLRFKLEQEVLKLYGEV